MTLYIYQYVGPQLKRCPLLTIFSTATENMSMRVLLVSDTATIEYLANGPESMVQVYVQIT